MKALRILFWLVAAVPVAAACYWASFASRLPEPWRERLVLGEVTPKWHWAELADTAGEPLHVVARALHLAALQVPDASIASVTWVNVLFAVLLVVALAGLCRRAFPATVVAGPLVFGLFGLLVASPAFGSNWLHGERAAVFLVPTLFVAALFWLQSDRRFVWSALLALSVAAVAPFCHIHGAAVCLALIPAVFAAARRAGSSRGLVWTGSLLVIGIAAVIFSTRSASSIGAAGADWFGSLMAEPVDTVMALIEATGAAWLDLLPTTRLDEQVLGVFSWLLPVLLWCLGDRSDATRSTAAPWWACLCFGLLLVVVSALRYELDPLVGSLREATFGAFLLPVGAIGVLAARFGLSCLAFGGGVLAVLAIQDCYLGIDQLRLAHMHGEHAEVALVLRQFAGPDGQQLAVRDPEELQLLEDRGWVPPTDPMVASIANAFSIPVATMHGTCFGGTATLLLGEVRSSLHNETAQWVCAVISVGDAPPTLVGNVRPEFADAGRVVEWQIEMTEPMPDGARVRAIGFVLRSHAFVALGPTFRVQDGKLVVESGS